MKRWKVTGVRQDGQDVSVVVRAETEDDAIKLAARNQISVTGVKRHSTAPSTPPEFTDTASPHSPTSQSAIPHQAVSAYSSAELAATIWRLITALNLVGSGVLFVVSVFSIDTPAGISLFVFATLSGVVGTALYFTIAIAIDLAVLVAKDLRMSREYLSRGPLESNDVFGRSSDAH